MQKTHSITLVMEETADDGRKFTYSVTKGPNTSKAEIFAAFKEMVISARLVRAKLDAIKAQINVNQIEAFLAQP
jgi:hypothetical protein